MEQYVIKGGNPLVGEVEIGGAKNAAIYATQILGATMPEWRDKIVEFKAAMAEG